ncbi:TetR/AcrR family transcriptional regulator [Amycolatopsis pithecellobii]|nr:TetR/AcrR family transcriptional regulator [Amycolatopsis pithecellobii]
MPTPPAMPARRRRPRNRREQILTVAACRFGDLGYHRVSMADIAAAVDIGASALYRHFRGKQDLLVAVVDDTLTELEGLVDDRADDLPAIVDALAHAALRRRHFGALWDRDLAYLPERDRHRLQSRMRALVSRVADLVAADAVGPAGEARLRAHALWAVLASPSRHRVDRDAARFAELLGQAAMAAVRAPLPTEPTLAPRQLPGAKPQLPVSRREAILTAAIRLFDRQGYPTVGLTDIGAAAGIAGPSIYNHFASKTEILSAALARGNEALWLALHHALTTADGVEDALEQTIDSYVTFAVNNPAMVSVLLSEVINLPAEQHDTYQRSQQAYVNEWVALLGRSQPHLPEPEVRLLVHAALGVTNDLVRVRLLQGRDRLPTEIAALARAVLGLGTLSQS